MNTFEKWWNSEGSAMRPLPGEDAEEHVRRISEIAWANGEDAALHGRGAYGNLADGMYLLALERDHTDWMKSHGPIVWEQPLAECDLFKVLEKAKSIGGRYGQMMLCRLVPMGEPAELQARLERVEAEILGVGDV